MLPALGARSLRGVSSAGAALGLVGVLDQVGRGGKLFGLVLDLERVPGVGGRGLGLLRHSGIGLFTGFLSWPRGRAGRAGC